MIRIVLILLLTMGGISALGQSYQPVDSGSSVKFVINNFGLSVDGTFKGLAGTIDFDPEALSASHFDVTVDATTIDTGVQLRNKHLKKEEYFDVGNYSKIRLVSTGITTSGAGKFTMLGKLTIKKTTRDVKFDFTAQKQSNGYLFLGSFTINRRDYDVGGGSFSLANDLTVSLSVVGQVKKN